MNSEENVFKQCRPVIVSYMMKKIVKISQNYKFHYDLLFLLDLKKVPKHGRLPEEKKDKLICEMKSPESKFAN